MEKRKFSKAKEAREFTVTRAHEFEDGSVSFNMETAEGVRLYGLRIIDGEKGPFISFPARKGADGKYWNHVYIEFTPQEREAIIQQVEEKLA